MKRGESWRGRIFVPLLLAAALGPAASAALRATASAQEGEVSAEDARARVLAKMPGDASVLINVTWREMPASPDILDLGKRSTKALERCLSDNVDVGIKRTCALLLGRLGDRAALPALQTALDDWEPDVRYWVIDALRLIPDRGSVPALIKLWNRKDETPGNRARVLAALGAAGSHDAVRVLRAELRAKKTERGDFRPNAFDALWQSRHLMARTTLVVDVGYALESDNEALVLDATEAAAELSAPQLSKQLVPLMEHPNEDVRNKAVYALGKIGDKAATRALLARLPQVRESRMLNNIAFALERLDRKAFYAAMKGVVEHKQAVIRLNAAFVLGDVKRPEGLPMLAKALEDPSDYVKTSAIVAMGKLGTPEAAKPLERFTTDANASIKKEAIFALNQISGGKRTDLVYERLFAQKRIDEATRLRAAIALADAGDARVKDYLVACYESGSCRRSEVRDYFARGKDAGVAGRLLVAWTRGDDSVTNLLATLRPSGTLPLAASTVDAALARWDDETAKSAIDLVGDLGDPSVEGGLEPRLVAKDTWLRVHTAVALVRLGHTAAEKTVFADLDNLAAAWLPSFVRALSRVAEPAVRKRLDAELETRAKGSDVPLALACAAVRLHWDPEGAFFRFLDALASDRVEERELAEYYLLREKDPKTTWVLRRALARETREHTRDRLRRILDHRKDA